MDTKSTVRNDVPAGDGFGAKCNSFWRTFRCGIATLMLSDPEPDGEAEGALRFAMARDVRTVNDRKRFAVKLPCINCVVLFAANRLFQGP
jgi:hypothetical protein